MAQLQNISHGQTNWDTAINQNFQNLDNDSGYIDLPILAPFSGTMRYRLRAHSVEINGFFIASELINSTTGASVVKLPTNITYGNKKQFISMTDNGGYASLVLGTWGSFDFYNSSNDITKNYVRIGQIFML